VMLITLAIATTLATIWDFKTREIPDTINFFLIFWGVLYWSYVSYVLKDAVPFMLSAIGLAVFFTIAFFLTKYDVWGGGDSKLLIGYGACIAPFGFMFSIWFLFFLFMIGVFSGIIYLQYLISKGVPYKTAKLKGIPFAHSFLISLVLTCLLPLYKVTLG